MKHIFKGKNFSATFTDENGYFSFTGDVSGASGAVVEIIVEIEPAFHALELLHLCDVETGRPMHAWENAQYALTGPALGGRQYGPDAAARALHLDNITDGPEKRAFEAWAKAYVSAKHAISENSMEELKGAMEDVAEIWAGRVEELEDALEELLDEYAPENRPEFVEPLDDEGEILPAYADIDIDELERRTALARFLNCNINDVEPVRHSETEFEAEGKEWLVMTETEADDAARERIRSYIDDALDIPENIRPYFDEDRFIEDVLRADGRGHVLNSWDGDENEESGIDETFFIYRR